MVIDYVAAQREKGGRGWPMVLAAEILCKKEGFSVLWSAADLAQDGCKDASASPLSERRRCGVTASSETAPVPAQDTSAVAAHKRWHFSPSSAKEWKAAGLVLYDERRCRVSYMKKQLT